MSRADELAATVETMAVRTNDRVPALRAELLRTRIRTLTDPLWTLSAAVVVLRSIVEELDAQNDHRGTAQALLELAFGLPRADALRATRRAVDVAIRADDPRVLADAIGYEAVELFWGPTPIAEGIARCEEILAMQVPNRGIEARALTSLGGFHAMLGEFEAGRSLVSRSRSILHELGTRNVAHPYFVGGYIGWLSDDMGEAAARWREGYDVFASIGETNRLSTLAALLGLAGAHSGDAREAMEYVRIAVEAGQPDDPDTQSFVRLAESHVRSAEGDHDHAVRLATEAVDYQEGRDSIWQLGDCYRILGDVLAAAGHAGEAADAYARALALYEAKGVVPLIERTKAALAAPDR
jgi:tetratricopeptide (TPR) repeat protein